MIFQKKHPTQNDIQSFIVGPVKNIPWQNGFLLYNENQNKQVDKNPYFPQFNGCVIQVIDKSIPNNIIPGFTEYPKNDTSVVVKKIR
jgi:hypothetical protein